MKCSDPVPDSGILVTVLVTIVGMPQSSLILMG